MTTLETYAAYYEDGELSPVKTMVKYFKENGYLDDENYLLKEPTSEQVDSMTELFEGFGFNPETVALVVGYLKPSKNGFRRKMN